MRHIKEIPERWEIKMKSSNKFKMFIAIFVILLVVYNIVFWIIFGFQGHEATFWISWIFMLVAFATLMISSVLLVFQRMELKDWLFGYPIVRHNTWYLSVEFIVSTLCVILEKRMPWQWAFTLQIILFAVYLVFAISCFLAKTTIDDVRTRVKDKTQYMKYLRSDVEMLCEKCGDAKLKPRLLKLAEAVRFSDPMSDEALADLEGVLSMTISECDHAITEQRFDEAEKLCEKASLLLLERNKKCKALK